MDSPLVQVLLSMVFHLLTLGLHCYAQPYIDKNVNRLESALLSIVCMFTIGGTYFYSNDVGGNAKEQWSIALLVLFLLGATMTPLAVAFDVFNKRSAHGAEAILINRIKCLMERESQHDASTDCTREASAETNMSSLSNKSNKSQVASKGLFDVIDALESRTREQSEIKRPKGTMAQVGGIGYVTQFV